ncbi:amidohydrolase family protein [Cryobacterium sp. PH29-G1]|uniref:amidohydrolase n=1 Tax=Cryobacterium sp. PH29-G1 TaxID=3046211 RepID=UPI0024BA8061|nr:amidohydrolase family protein [Cryobacterium sp. PH29-G1]MDJ0350645.1 amidohydrolase family protein [Cryobacterium sp. PH29-G1]
MPDLVLRSVRQPGDATVSDLYITDGVVTHIVPAGTTMDARATDRHRPAHDGPDHDGPDHDGPAHDGPAHDGPDHDGPDHDGPTRPRPTHARIVDLAGRTVIPGLWDEHVHMTQWALAGARFDLSAAASAREALELVRAQIIADAPATPLIGVRFRDAIWADAPTLHDLDEVTQGHPTALISHDLHCVWLNSAAAERFGVPVDASGLLREQAAFALTIALGQLPDAEVDALAAQAGTRAAARGVVGIVDFEMTWNRDVWQRRISHGFNALRVDAGIYLADLDRAIAERMHTGDRIADTHGLLTVGPLKLLIDGSLNTRTAFCVDEYPVGGHGMLTVSEDELTAILLAAKRAALLPAVHAIGDAANTVALNAFERAAIAFERDADARTPTARGAAEHAQFLQPEDFARADAALHSRAVVGRIEHAQFLRTEDFARFARLGVTASVQPEHALDDRDAVELNWAAGAARAFALRSLLDAGATLAFGSDAPVAPLDPFTAMSAASSRARSDGRGPWRPDQVITRQQALAASARGRTRLRVGDVADIAVLDGDPLTVSDATFERMPVAATLLAGRATHGAALLAP